MWCNIYVTVGCPPVRLSVCMFHRSTAVATCGCFAAELGRGTARISIDSCRRRYWLQTYMCRSRSEKELKTSEKGVKVTMRDRKVKVAHTRLPSVGFRSWFRSFAVSQQVTWVINPAVGCHNFPPGLQLPPQLLRGLLPIILLGEQRHNGCEQFA